MPDTVTQDRAKVAFLGYAVVLGIILLNPSAALPAGGVSFVSEAADWIGLPAWLVAGHRVEFAMNVGVMVPLAVLGMLAWSSLGWRDWTAYGFVISLSVEAVQAVALAARSATYVDVVANTAGTMIGALAVSWWRRRRPLAP